MVPAMDTKLRQLIQRFTSDLESWLAEPSEAETKLNALRSQIEDLKSELRADGLADVLKGLETAAKGADRQKQRQAADAIAELCKPLGVILEAREPPKRKPRSKAKGQPAGE